MGGITPIYNIHYPNGSSKANALGPELQQMATDVESALKAAQIPPAQPMSIVVAASEGARNAHWGIPDSESARLALQSAGATTVRTDKGWTERYYATYNAASNPNGATPAGWYPVEGALPFGRVKRSTNAATFVPTAYFDASADQWWQASAALRVNIDTYIGGWKAPLNGIYHLEAVMHSLGATSAIAGFCFAPVTTPSQMFGGTSPSSVQNHVFAHPTADVRLNAGDVVKLSTLVAGGNSAWQTGADASVFSMRYVGPPTGP